MDAYYYDGANRTVFRSTLSGGDFGSSAHEIVNGEGPALWASAQKGCTVDSAAVGSYVVTVADFSDAKNSKKSELSTTCEQAIIMGMVSSDALGTTHTYDARRDDQANVQAAYFEANADSISKDIMCSDGTSYEFRAHTAAQALTVMKALSAHVRLKRDRLKVVKGQVNAIDPLDTVTYPTHMDVIDAIEAVTF